MKPNTYVILQDCLEKGISAGWYRAHKHTDTPGEETIKEKIEEAILLEISNYFIFDENGNV
jgi:hypothetical protein